MFRNLSLHSGRFLIFYREKYDSSLIRDIEDYLLCLCTSHNVPEEYGFRHFLLVATDIKRALDYERLPKDIGTQLVVAGLCHDLDNHKIKKFFNFSEDDEYSGVKSVLKAFNLEKWETLIIEVISLVSTLKNRNIPLFKERWKLIVRDANRRCSLGKEGIKRCKEFALKNGNPLLISTTPLPTTINELEKVIKKYNLEDYVKRGKSDSMLDHFYDKLFHLGVGGSNNYYLQRSILGEMEYMKKWIINFNANYLIIQNFDISNKLETV